MNTTIKNGMRTARYWVLQAKGIHDGWDDPILEEWLADGWEATSAEDAIRTWWRRSEKAFAEILADVKAHEDGTATAKVVHPATGIVDFDADIRCVAKEIEY